MIAPTSTAASSSTRPIWPGRSDRSIGAPGGVSSCSAMKLEYPPKLLLCRTAPQPQDGADHFRHGLIVLHRNLVIDFDCRVQRARQRRILHDPDPVLRRHGPDPQSNGIDTL